MHHAFAYKMQYRHNIIVLEAALRHEFQIQLFAICNVQSDQHFAHSMSHDA